MTELAVSANDSKIALVDGVVRGVVCDDQMMPSKYRSWSGSSGSWYQPGAVGVLMQAGSHADRRRRGRTPAPTSDPRGELGHRRGDHGRLHDVVEVAGALAELIEKVLCEDFHDVDISRARVVLVEQAPELLGPFSPRSRRYARRELERHGVEVLVGEAVQRVGEDEVALASGEVIRTRALVWAAGVKAGALADRLGLATARGGRVTVEADLSMGLPGTAVIGMPDPAITQSRDRIRAAVLNSGHRWPDRRITLALSPAALRKSGAGRQCRALEGLRHLGKLLGCRPCLRQIPCCKLDFNRRL